MLFFDFGAEQNFSNENTLIKRLLRITFPFIFVYSLLALYITLGAHLFYYTDDEMAKSGIANLSIFAFTAIATIGYGNIYPTNDDSRLLCVIYSLLGIPLCLVCLDSTVKTFARLHWLLDNTVRRVRHVWFRGEIRLPFGVAVGLVLSSFMFKALCFDKRFHFTLEDLYFCIVSFSTVGLGDIYVTSRSNSGAVLKIVFLIYGTICTSAFFAVMGQWYLRMFRRRKKNVPIDGYLIVGDRQVRLKKLLLQMSTKLNISPSELKTVIKEMKELIEISEQY
ncbi:unnamed protein product [Bursaphelenchus okinawaensis]|uniref:Potassium channel domain-containing protein n=1 Tax=Bursaphelenchus okinawaensis TaxID=465554 RepID=A0A811K3D9_9BILA|nr:unnamed protein product [Bursaphelenchus okinawaensis]CAG9090871.1 unnamed protein product [Bursaphelenchus okinawaensis]